MDNMTPFSRALRRSSSSPPICTKEVSWNLRNILKHKDISLKQFAWHELKISSPRLSSLIKHPLPWYKLRTRGRQVYERMHQWVQMVENRKYIKQIVEGALTEGKELDKFVLCKDFTEEIVEEKNEGEVIPRVIKEDVLNNDHRTEVEGKILTELQTVPVLVQEQQENLNENVMEEGGETEEDELGNLLEVLEDNDQSGCVFLLYGTVDGKDNYESASFHSDT